MILDWATLDTLIGVLVAAWFGSYALLLGLAWAAQTALGTRADRLYNLAEAAGSVVATAATFSAVLLGLVVAGNVLALIVAWLL